MKAIESISAHFQKFVGAGRAFIDVPEWGDESGKPLRIFWKPMTIRERKKIMGAKNEEAEAVFLKAEDESGARLFTEPAEFETLASGADGAIVARVANAMVASPSVRELEKN